MTTGHSTLTFAEVRSRGPVRAAAGLMGPAFVASVAYVDPGNIAANFTAGALTGYQLAWVIVMANGMAMLVQYLTAKVGLATGRTLPELCGERFGGRTNVALWLQAEAVAMATDLAEFVGAAAGLHLVFGIPMFPSGLITAVAALILLGLEQRGYRRFELAIIALLALVGLGFGYLFLRPGGQDYARLAAGMVPRLSGGGSLDLAMAIIGATVMPHAIYLHSALHKDRITAATPTERRALLRWNARDCALGLGLAGVVNLAMLCVAAALSRRTGPGWTGDLGAIHDKLAALAGWGAALVFGVTLMAAGLSSSSVGTQAGQVVMAGFTGWRISLAVRRVLTMLPSLVVLGLGLNVTQVLVYSQVALSLGIPFALVPLVTIASDRRTMTDMVNRRGTTAAALAVTAVIVALNCWLLADTVHGLG